MAPVGKRILITGASSGIGLALTRQLAAQNEILACGGRPEVPQAIALENVHYVSADLSAPLEASRFIRNRVDHQFGQELDLAIFNAGTGKYCDPLSESIEDAYRTLDVNVRAPIFLAQELADHLLSVGGTMVLIGSVAHKGSPNMASYAASKAAMDGFGRALRQEWLNRATVMVIHPGPTDTPIFDHAGFDPGKLRNLFLRPEEMAAEIIASLEKAPAKRSISFGVKLRNKLLPFLTPETVR